MLKGKNILLGITGSIAAYKATLIVRLLIKEGANVQVILTPAAKNFITPLTLSTLSKNPVLSDFTSDSVQSIWSNHVQLSRWADVLLIAPASANTIAKMANGVCDNLLLAVYFSFPLQEKSIFFAPAMDLEMYQHPSNKRNIKQLQSYGNILILPDSGELASGMYGAGRMTEPEVILNTLQVNCRGNLPLNGKKILVTAGPTYEPIDPIRFISNHSSGKMGFAIADEAAKLGAEVTLITGPVALPTPEHVARIDIVTSEDLHKECFSYFASSDIIIMAAAVADFTPEDTKTKKIKKKASSLSLHLKLTKDILAEMGMKKSKKQVLVGFALESDDELKHAKAKLKEKNLDMIVLNSIKDKDACFGVDTNKVTIINKENKVKSFDLKTKKEVAKDILKELINRKI